MSYSLHIRRVNPITLDDWNGAVIAVNNVRSDTGDLVAELPGGEQIRIPGKLGDAAICIEDEWRKYFRFSNGEVSFDPSSDWDFETSEKNIVVDLIHSLGAQLFGDEGERYDSFDLS